MGCLGVHFSLSAEEVDKLRSFEDDAERLEHLQEVIETEYFERQPERKAESDKAWDAMHRALAGGGLDWDGGDYPLNHVVMAGEPFYFEDDYLMSLKTPQQVRDAAAALPAITEDDFRRRYFAIDAGDYGFDLTEEDFEYTWNWFQEVREFWLRAAAEDRFVLFTASQ